MTQFQSLPSAWNRFWGWGPAAGGRPRTSRPSEPPPGTGEELGRRRHVPAMTVTPLQRQQKPGQARQGGSCHQKNHQLHFPAVQNKGEQNSILHHEPSFHRSHHQSLVGSRPQAPRHRPETPGCPLPLGTTLCLPKQSHRVPWGKSNGLRAQPQHCGKGPGKQHGRTRGERATELPTAATPVRWQRPVPLFPGDGEEEEGESSLREEAQHATRPAGVLAGRRALVQPLITSEE